MLLSQGIVLTDVLTLIPASALACASQETITSTHSQHFLNYELSGWDRNVLNLS